MAAGVKSRGTTSKSNSNKIPSIIVHSVFISCSCAALACALIALGTACYAVGSDPYSGPCPNYLQGLVFGAAGGLTLLSVILFTWVVRKRKRKLENRALEEFIANAGANKTSDVDPLSATAAAGNEHPNENQGDDGVNGQTVRDNSLYYDNTEEADAVLEEMERIIQEEKSAEVSYWVEHQGASSYELPPPPPPDFSDEEGLKSAETEEADDRNSSRSEVTAL